jgi:hypothetical protein
VVRDEKTANWRCECDLPARELTVFAVFSSRTALQRKHCQGATSASHAIILSDALPRLCYRYFTEGAIHGGLDEFRSRRRQENIYEELGVYRLTSRLCEVSTGDRDIQRSGLQRGCYTPGSHVVVDSVTTTKEVQKVSVVIDRRISKLGIDRSLMQLFEGSGSAVSTLLGGEGNTIKNRSLGEGDLTFFGAPGSSDGL